MRSSVLLLIACLAFGLGTTVTSTQNQTGLAKPPPAATRAQQAPQDPPSTPIFRSSVQYVEVDARVLDAKGNPIRDLKKEDFRLLEDNVAQTIDTFTSIDIPIEIDAPPADTAGRPLSSDVATNLDQIGPQGRLFVVLLDDRQIDATRTYSTIRIVKQFIDKNLGRRDQAAILTTSGRTDVGRNFTSNKEALSKSVEGFMGRKPESLALQRARFPEADPSNVGQLTEHFQEARLALQALESVCNWLGQINGMTKSLIYVSEGLDYNYESDSDPEERKRRSGPFDPWATEILAQQRITTAAATRANVTVFPVDPRGLGQDDSIVVSSVPEGPSIMTQLRQEMNRAHASLREIAADTGGVEAVNTNDFDAALARIIHQSSSYYLLGYHPKNARRDGRFRTITLAVNRPGAQVVARRGYGEPNAKASPAAPFAGPPGASPAVSGALNSPLPINEMTLSTTAVAFRASDSRASVAVIVESPSLTFTPKDGKYVGSFEIITAALDDRNVIAAGTTSKIAFGLSAEAFQQIQKLGFRSLAELKDLKPGRYELRIAVANKDTAKRGMVSYPFEVPDFSKGKLQMSGLLVSSLAESRTPTGNPDKVLGDRTPLPPTTVRQFRVGDELTLTAEIYDNDLKAEHRVELTTTVRAADGTEAFSSSDWASFDELTAANGAYRISMWVPLADVEPGDYILSIEARRTSNDDDKPVVKSIPIRIVK